LNPSIIARLRSISANFIAQKPRQPEETALHSLGTQADGLEASDGISRQTHAVVHPEQLAISFEVWACCEPAERGVYLPRQNSLLTALDARGSPKASQPSGILSAAAISMAPEPRLEECAALKWP